MRDRLLDYRDHNPRPDCLPEPIRDLTVRQVGGARGAAVARHVARLDTGDGREVVRVNGARRSRGVVVLFDDCAVPSDECPSTGLCPGGTCTLRDFYEAGIRG